MKKNYVKGQGQKRRPLISGMGSSSQTCHSQSSQASSFHGTMHTPADCVRAICQDRSLPRMLRTHLTCLDAKDLAAVVADAAGSQDPSVQVFDFSALLAL